MDTWCPTQAEWDEALDLVEPHVLTGYDSEFDGVDLNTQSAAGRARVHVFSVATPTPAVSALGYNVPQSFVFPEAAMRYPRMKTWLENPDAKKAIHNQPVDSHAAWNSGINLRGGINTLDMARFLYPWRSQLMSGNFDLDSLCRWKVGYGKTEDFEEFLGYDAQEEYTAEVEKKECACGALSCRKQKAPHDHKWPVLVTVTHSRRVRKITPLIELVPGHPLWARYIPYAAVDAELALILYQMMVEDGQKNMRPFPWVSSVTF